MQVVIDTSIHKFLSAIDKNGCLNKVLYKGSDSKDNSPNHFEVEYVEENCIVVNNLNYNTLSVDVFDKISFDKTKVSFVSFYLIDQSKQVLPRFQLSLNGVIFGKQSHFMLTNMENYNVDILLDDFDNPEDQTFYLFTFVGGKTI